MKNKKPNPFKPPIVSSKLIRETAEAKWFLCVLRDGRVLKMSVPKDRE